MNHLLVMPRFVDTIGKWYHFPMRPPHVSSGMKQVGLCVSMLIKGFRASTALSISLIS